MPCFFARFGVLSLPMWYTAAMKDNHGAIIPLLLTWYDAHKRRFPFRDSGNPYYVWLSEIMLQQTRTETVTPYFTRFIARFPTVEELAGAEETEVLKGWEGLGYYSRARNLLKAARLIAQQGFPTTAEALQQLPGIGPYTAAAVASIAFQQPVPAMDGNLNRVIARLFNVGDNIGRPAIKRLLYEKGQSLIPLDRPGDMNQALMDLGATICLPGTPDCHRCPLAGHCLAYQDGAPETLPVMDVKKPPKEVDMAVVLVTNGGRVLLRKREEALLKGLYVFLLLEDAAALAQTKEQLQKLGIPAKGLRALGKAKHVFTHRVWHMTVYHLEAATAPHMPKALWATAEDIRALPLPTAMKAAKQWALEVLEGE